MSLQHSAERPWDAIPKWPRRIVTVWLLFHLLAIVSAPASVAPASDLARAAWNVCRPYLQVLYLNHGYHYFAPDPGESTLLSYRIDRTDGARIEGTIPHRHIWPRLLYHRHFMLTESLGLIAAVSDREQLQQGSQPPSEPAAPSVAVHDETPVVSLDDDALVDESGPPPPPSGLLRDWYHSYARCLLDRYDGDQVRLVRLVHYLPPIEWMQESLARGEPLTLSEPQSFAEFPIGTFDWNAGPIDATSPRGDGESDRPQPATPGSGLVQAAGTDGSQP